MRSLIQAIDLIALSKNSIETKNLAERIYAMVALLASKIRLWAGIKAAHTTINEQDPLLIMTTKPNHAVTCITMTQT